MKRFCVLFLTLITLIAPFAIPARAQTDEPPIEGEEGDPVSLVIYRSGDTLTLYVGGEGLVSLEGLTIEATTITGTKLQKQLNEFPAFKGLPFDRIVAPSCFHLEGTQRTTPLPIVCREVPTNRLFTDKLIPADMIWYDSVGEEPRVILITRDDEIYGQCPATLSECEIIYTPPVRETVSATPTREIPGLVVIPVTGTATVQKATPFREGPGADYPIIETVRGGTYDVTGRNEAGSYYQVDYNGREAWVTAFAQGVVFKVEEQAAATAEVVPLDAILTYGQTVSGELARNEHTDYTFIGIKGEIVSIVIDAKFDSYLELNGPDGFTLYEDDNAGGNNNPQMNGFTLPTNGEYRITLRGYSARQIGSFRLTLLKGNVPDQTTGDNTIQYGENVTDTLTANEEVVRAFRGTQGDVISIIVDAEFDSYIQLQDEQGEVLITDDDTGGNMNPLVEFYELPYTGDYRIVLRGRSARSVGTYTLTLTQGIAGEETPIKYGQSLTERLDAEGNVVFVFEGTARDRISVSIESDFDAFLVLRDERGELITEDDDSGGRLQPALLDELIPATGTYFLIVSGKSESDEGSFTITLSAR